MLKSTMGSHCPGTYGPSQPPALAYLSSPSSSTSHTELAPEIHLPFHPSTVIQIAASAFLLGLLHPVNPCPFWISWGCSPCPLHLGHGPPVTDCRVGSHCPWLSLMAYLLPTVDGVFFEGRDQGFKSLCLNLDTRAWCFACVYC
jgi:hypothetical protein